MPETTWQILPQHLHSEMRFNLALLIAHRQIFDRYMAGDALVNKALGFHLYGYQQQGIWRQIQILTPWMLARLWFSDSPPDIPVPENSPKGDDYQPLGTEINLPEELGRGVAYLNYHPTLGHYLLQPITLDMTGYETAQEVFDTWSHDLQMLKTANIQRPERKAV